MSVFKVKLNNVNQGLLDLDPSTATSISALNHSQLGSQFAVSKQRTIYVTGPGKTYRKLKDGEQFTDCNYWKRFAYPQVPLEEAFIEVVTDDGSVYSDVAEENTFARVWNILVPQGTSFTDNVIDILGTTGGHTVFTEIVNQGSTAVRVRVNGSADAVFDLGAGEHQIFNAGELAITKLEFVNNVSGGTTADIQVIASIRSVCKS